MGALAATLSCALLHARWQRPRRLGRSNGQQQHWRLAPPPTPAPSPAPPGCSVTRRPLMLELGVHPQVSSATSGLMVLFSASLAALSFAAAGRLNTPHAAVFAAVCLAAAFCGVLLVSRAVRRSGRASIVVALLACIMGERAGGGRGGTAGGRAAGYRAAGGLAGWKGALRQVARALRRRG